MTRFTSWCPEDHRSYEALRKLYPSSLSTMGGNRTVWDMAILMWALQWKPTKELYQPRFLELV